MPGPLQSAQMVYDNAHRGASTKSGIHMLLKYAQHQGIVVGLGWSYVLAIGQVSSLLKTGM